MAAGYIKLARCLLDKPMFQNEKLLKVWVWCLLKASHKEHEYLVGLQKVKVMPGQFVTGRYAGSQQLKMKPSTFWDYMQWLKDNQSIDINSDNKKSLVTIINWELYQVNNSQSDNNPDSTPTTIRQQSDTNKNDKNDKNKHMLCYTSNEALIEAIKDFIKMRNKIKKPMTDRALTMMLGKLDNLATNDNEKIEILNQSILKCWQDIYKIGGDDYGKRVSGVRKQKAGRNPSEVDWSEDGDL